jgi:superfamily I DNA and/or RNA helicase
LLDKYGLAEEDFKTSLFSHLSRNLPEEATVTLNMQHRMVPPIGNLVSECFYNGELESNGPEIDTTLSTAFPMSVMWFSTVRLAQRFETRSGQSYFNSTEAKKIAELLRVINAIAIQAGKRFKVAVIAGYLAQVDEIQRAIYQSPGGLEGIDLECDSVDAFQGRESDVLIYSVTRMNPEGKIGFLKEYERINVAMSRGRLYLAIVGDHVFCRSASGENPFRPIVEHIERNPDVCKIATLSN